MMKWAPMWVAPLRQLFRSIRVSGPLWAAALVLDRLGLPALRRWPAVTVGTDLLGEQVTSVLRAWGMPEEEAAVTTGHLLWADLRGIGSHGCAMLAQYQR
jgi:hypothetical protein